MKKNVLESCLPVSAQGGRTFLLVNILMISVLTKNLKWDDFPMRYLTFLGWLYSLSGKSVSKSDVIRPNVSVKVIRSFDILIKLELFGIHELLLKLSIRLRSIILSLLCCLALVQHVWRNIWTTQAGMQSWTIVTGSSRVFGRDHRQELWIIIAAAPANCRAQQI